MWGENFLLHLPLEHEIDYFLDFFADGLASGGDFFRFSRCSSNFFLFAVEDGFALVICFFAVLDSSFFGVEEYFATNWSTLNLRLQPA